MSCDERSCKLATLVVESFGRLGKEGSNLIDQVAPSIVGGTDESSLLIPRKGVCKECLFQIIYVTTQVAISRRVRSEGPSGLEGGGKKREDYGHWPAVVVLMRIKVD